jgi:hypothetical protein
MAAEFLGEFLLRHLFHSGWREPQIAIAANSVGGFVGALLVDKLLFFEAERERLRKELNHQIRNALQPIIYCTYRLGGSEKQVIQASVDKIEVCLQESLLMETPRTTGINRIVN